MPNGPFDKRDIRQRRKDDPSIDKPNIESLGIARGPMRGESVIVGWFDSKG